MKNFKSLFKFASICLLFISFIFSSCSKKQYSESLTMIPHNATIVGSIDLKTLGEKGNIKDFKQSAMFKDILDDMKDSPTMKGIFENPKQSGVNLEQVYLFVLPSNKFGISADLKSASNFKSTLEKAIKESKGEGVSIKTDNGISYLEQKDVDASVLWNDDKVLVMYGSFDEAKEVFNTKEDSSIVKNTDFAQFYKEKKEIAFWLNYETLMKQLYSLPMLPEAQKAFSQQMVDKMKGLYIHANLTFNKGDVTGTMQITPTDAAKKLYDTYYKKGIDTKLLTSFPEQSFALIGMALNWSGLWQEMIQDGGLSQYEKMLPAEVLHMMSTWKGDITASLFGFSESNIPTFAAAISVSDTSIQNMLIEKVLNSMPKENKEGYTMFAAGEMLNFFLAQKDDRLMFTNDENVVQNFSTGTALPKNLATSQFSKELQTPAYCYLNLDLETYPKNIKAFLAAMLPEAAESLSVLKDFKVTYDTASCKSTAVLRLKNTQENSLAVIAKTIEKFN